MIFEIQRNGKAAPKLVETSSLTDEGWSEKDLENYLRENLPKLISGDLMVIGQSRPYQPEADLLALDAQAAGGHRRKALEQMHDVDVTTITPP